VTEAALGRDNFARVNDAALAVLPTLLARWLPDGKQVAPSGWRAIHNAPIGTLAASRSTSAPADGRTLRLA
jgi:hypothetical protein